MKQKENELAIIISKVSNERKFRRVREFSLRALASQRHGIRIENENEMKRKEEERIQKEMENKIREKQELIESALKVDSKWLHSDSKTSFLHFNEKKKLSALQKHTGFGANKPAPMLRLHQKSWRLQIFDEEDGIPLTEDGAAEVSFFII